MKRNKILGGIALLMSTLAISSCSKSFLEPTPKGETLTSDYYQTPADALNGLIAAYAPMEIGYHNGYCPPEGLANAASDECYGGGATASDQPTWTALNNMTQLTPAVMPEGLWAVGFMGVQASNQILANLGACGLDTATLVEYTAEAQFLRAYYYFRLVRWFGNIPLFTSPTTTDGALGAVQATPVQVYAQIEQDLKAAIPNLPVTAVQNGRASQGMAIALLGKVYLYEADGVPGALNTAGTAALPANSAYFDSAATELALVNGTPGGVSQYGYSLMANYGDIFTQKFNSESILELQYSQTQNYQDWSGSSPVGNIYQIMCGPRSYNFISAPAPTIVTGWGFTPITYDLYDSMVVNGQYDPRYQYTIYNIDSFSNLGLCSYAATPWTMGFPTTGYNIAKFAPLQMWNGAGAAGLNYGEDYIEIRLADTYLMEAEAIVNGGGNMSRALALVNAVRARVGLPALTTVTMGAIKHERHMELATEGHRWFDLVRWGDAPTVLDNMVNGYSKNFTAGKNEYLPIPLSELEIATQLKQNPGY